MPETIATKEWIAATRQLSRSILAILIAHPNEDQAREALAYVASELIATGEDLEDVRDGIDELDEEDELEELTDAENDQRRAELDAYGESLGVRDLMGDDLSDEELRDIVGTLERETTEDLDRVLGPEVRILPFPPTEFMPGETKFITVQPMLGIQPRKLMIPSSIGPEFQILEVLVGRKAQAFGAPETVLIADAPVSAVAYSKRAVGANFTIPELEAGDMLTLHVHRIPEAPLTFRALIDCVAPKKGPGDVSLSS